MQGEGCYDTTLTGSIGDRGDAGAESARGSTENVVPRGMQCKVEARRDPNQALC